MAAVQVTGGASAPPSDAVEGTVPRTAVPRRWPTSVVAERTGVSEMTLLRWRSRVGLGPQVDGPGHRVRYTWREMLVAACWAEMARGYENGPGGEVGRRFRAARGQVRVAVLGAPAGGLAPWLYAQPDAYRWLRSAEQVTGLDGGAWWLLPVHVLAERIGR